MIVSDLLNPNKLIKRNTQRYIVLSWVFLTLLIWIFSPFIFLPKPGEIWAALQDLWTYDNLATELMTSIMLNLEAIGVATIVSLGLAYLMKSVTGREFQKAETLAKCIVVYNI
jgi:ABC-type nitrate/sulfonate/bicarbonate transport system permease component